MSIVVSDISYRYPGQELLFEHISFSLPPGGKVSVVGNNGAGKSTLLKLLAGRLTHTSGAIRSSSQPCYVPQQVDDTGGSVAEILGVADMTEALRAICNGSVEQIHYDILADNWDIELRCRAALDHWGLGRLDLDFRTDSLSGGEKTRIYLAGLLVHEPGIILFDEPTNHLDHTGRQKLYDYMRDCKAAVIAVSHDVTLLGLPDSTYELSPAGLRLYGGNYAFYREQKEIEECALRERIDSGRAALDLARRKAREVRERQDRRSSQGKRSGKKGGIPRIVMNARGNLAENSAAGLKRKHSGSYPKTAKD